MKAVKVPVVPVRPKPRLFSLIAVLCGFLMGVACAGAAKPNQNGPLTIPADVLGYQPMPPIFAAQGGTEFTLHFVDETHLLFTFGVRTLMPRLADAAPEDQDRNVAAVLLELPTGKVLARTQWRTRDHDKFLWPLGQGRFLLRVRSRLTLLDPLENIAEHGVSEAFSQQEVMTLKRPIGYISVAPAGDLMGIETIPPRKPKLTGGAASAAAMAATVPGYKPEPEPREKDGLSPVQILFFRLMQGHTREGKPRLSVRAAGLIGAPNLIELPATGEGFLEIAQDKDTKRGWLFDFVTHTGKRTQLSGYETSCAPRTFWVSRSEFVAFGCSGANEKQELGYFNLRGEEPWVQMLRGTHVSPTIVAAPTAGRLALSRTLVNSTIFDLQEITPDLLQGQEITVMQAHDGRTLLKVLATPIQRVGQNFDLSANGLQFAVFRSGNIEVYKLPELTARDEKELKAAIELYPAPSEAEVKLNAHPVTSSRDDEEGTSPGATSTEAPEPAKADVDAVTPKANVGFIQNGDGEDAETGRVGPRKAPSLYSGDHPRTSEDSDKRKQ